jgi:hypothetical protein
MPGDITLAILSDVHYASAAEQKRGGDYEFKGITNPAVRILLKAFRHFIWLRNPLLQNYLLQSFLQECAPAQVLVANGDFSCDSAFIGLSDDAAFQSARECLDQLRQRFGAGTHAVFGDHELGKHSLAGGQGGLRLASFHRACGELQIKPFWTLRFGRYVLMGVTSSLIALPVFKAEALPEEWGEWQKLRNRHLDEIRTAFAGLQPKDRVLLFCHDPTALPFLGQEEMVRRNFGKIEQTVIGHLHSRLILFKSRVLAGMPAIGFLGHPVKRISTALRDARDWRPFRVRVCPSLAGIELLKDGGYYTARLDPEAQRPILFQFHSLRRQILALGGTPQRRTDKRGDMV